MKNIEYRKKYVLSCFNYESEGIYIGKKRKKRLKNNHFFMVWHSFMKEDEKPIIIGCQKFKLKEDNKLETGSLYFPKLSKREEEYVTNLAKKYW